MMKQVFIKTADVYKMLSGRDIFSVGNMGIISAGPLGSVLRAAQHVASLFLGKSAESLFSFKPSAALEWRLQW